MPRKRHVKVHMVHGDPTRPMGREDLSRNEALAAFGEVVYAVRVGEAVKIGHTTNMAHRFTQLGADEILAFRPGTYADEQAIHEDLADHRHHAREWYHPTDAVMAVVNDMRAALGLEPAAA